MSSHRTALRLGRLAGVPIGIQPLWLVIVGLLTYTLGRNYFPGQDPRLSTGAAYTLGLLSALTLFAGILLHELGHAVWHGAGGCRSRRSTCGCWEASLVGDQDAQMLGLAVSRWRVVGSTRAESGPAQRIFGTARLSGRAASIVSPPRFDPRRRCLPALTFGWTERVDLTGHRSRNLERRSQR